MPLSKAAQNLTLADATTFIAVSSYDRSNHTIRVTGGFRGMTAITWHEDSDEPCKLVLDTKHLNRQDINEPQIILHDVYTHAGKQPCSSPGNKKEVKLTGSDNWIYKIRACTTDKRSSSDDQ